MSNKIDAKDVEIFLLDNLDFFESRESLVSELKFKHSSSSASSLLERQIIKLRDEQKDLMDLLSSFVKEASANEERDDSDARKDGIIAKRDVLNANRACMLRRGCTNVKRNGINAE